MRVKVPCECSTASCTSFLSLTHSTIVISQILYLTVQCSTTTARSSLKYSVRPCYFFDNILDKRKEFRCRLSFLPRQEIAALDIVVFVISLLLSCETAWICWASWRLRRRLCRSHGGERTERNDQPLNHGNGLRNPWKGGEHWVPQNVFENCKSTE